LKTSCDTVWKNLGQCTSRSPVTILAQLQCDVAGVCVLQVSST